MEADTLIISKQQHGLEPQLLWQFILWLLFIATLYSPNSFGGEPPPYLTETEFRNLAEQLSPKVDVFGYIWSIDPEAEFYGGTTRDFLYWVKGRFQNSSSREQSLQIRHDLLLRESIEGREFILGESDIDIITEKSVQIDPGTFGIRKIDTHDFKIFDTESVEGLNERLQGYIPAEKIRLGSRGFTENVTFGKGLSEIYQGRLTVHFTPEADFSQSLYAQRMENHQVLLALRYLRLLAMDYFNSYGSGYPDTAHLFAIDTKSRQDVERILNSVLDGKSLKPYLERERFNSWLNGTIRKAFRSYTNPTAAYLLMKEFKVDQLTLVYEGVESINDYVFVKKYDLTRTASMLKKFEVDQDKFYLNFTSEFPDQKYYHGTRSKQNLSNIVLQGALPSSHGNAGRGLYGVGIANFDDAASWASDPKLVVEFEIDGSKAHLVDVTRGEGKRVFELYNKQYDGRSANVYDAFADDFSIDIIKYPYSFRAFVLKNSAVIKNRQGVYYKIRTLHQLLQTIEKIETTKEFVEVIDSTSISPYGGREISFLEKAILGAKIWKRLEQGSLEGLHEFELLLQLMRTSGNLTAVLKPKLESIALNSLSKLNEVLRSSEFTPTIIGALIRQMAINEIPVEIGRAIAEFGITQSKLTADQKTILLQNINSWAMAEETHSVDLRYFEILSPIFYGYPGLLKDLLVNTDTNLIFEDPEMQRFYFSDAHRSEFFWKLFTKDNWWNYARIYQQPPKDIPIDFFISSSPLELLGSVQWNWNAKLFLLEKVYSEDRFLKHELAADRIMQFIAGVWGKDRVQVGFSGDFQRDLNYNKDDVALLHLVQKALVSIVKYYPEKAVELAETIIKHNLWANSSKFENKSKAFERLLTNILAAEPWSSFPLKTLWIKMTSERWTSTKYQIHRLMQIQAPWQINAWTHRVTQKSCLETLKFRTAK